MKKIAEISVKRGWLVVDADGYLDWYENKPKFDDTEVEWKRTRGAMFQCLEVDSISREQSKASLVRIPRACKISLVIEE